MALDAMALDENEADAHGFKTLAFAADYAPDLPQAQAYIQTMLEPFQPGKPPLILPQSC